MRKYQIQLHNFENLENGNISLKMLQTSQYWYYQIPNTLDFNPGSVVIYDINDVDKQPLFVLFPDGRIQTWNNNYILKYDNYQDFIKLQLIHKNTSWVIAEVVYALNGWYIIE